MHYLGISGDGKSSANAANPGLLAKWPLKWCVTASCLWRLYWWSVRKQVTDC